MRNVPGAAVTTINSVAIRVDIADGFSDGSARLAAGIPVQVCLTPATTPGRMAELLVDAYLAAASTRKR